MNQPPSTQATLFGPPARVRRRRVKGWRMPPGAVYVGRPTRFGNPFTLADALADQLDLTEAQARECCARMYGLWLAGELFLTDPAAVEQRAWILGHLDRLTGRTLACWCPPGPCHADRLIELANPEGHRDG